MRIFDIATMGTSLTACNASDGGMWQPALARALAPGKSDRVRIYNCGAGGVTSSYGLSVGVPLVKKYRPKAVTIEYLTNDCAIGNSISQAQSEANTVAIIDSLRADLPDIQVFLMIMNPMLPGQTSRAALGAYNEIYRDLAASLGVGLIDTWPAWGSPTTTEIPDGIHPTLAANLAFALPEMVEQLSAVID